MRNFFEWAAAQPDFAAKPWLLLGKGPSFAGRHDHDLAAFHTMALNHAVREQPVMAAHMIDFEVFEACRDVIAKQAGVVIMPWVPHADHQPGPHDLAALCEADPMLRRLSAEGRLLWYNLGTAPAPRGDTPVIPVRFFSAEAALGLLATAGAGCVRSLGIDGGAAYSAEFDDLKDKTLLSNGRSSFDRQFERIAGIIQATGVDFAPLDVPAPVRVFVAATESELLPTRVLEFSIKQHASMRVEVTPLCDGPRPPLPREPRNRPRTPFSFQRFLIPAMAGYRGRAIYMDSDMQVFADIRHLWTTPMAGADLLAARVRGDTLRRPQFSVMLLDCDRLRWDVTAIVQQLDTGALSYEELMHDMKVADAIRADIGPEWNSLEWFREGETALLHYTDMNTQPWVSTENPLGYLWMRDLFKAIDQGVIAPALVQSHVEKGFVRPSLLYQLEHRIEDPLLLPRKAKDLDKAFRAPFTRIGRSWRTPFAWSRALIREAYRQSPLYPLERRIRERLSM